MVRTPCCDKKTVKKGTWSAEEDAILTSYADSHGAITNWIALPQKIGLNRCGKSCRLRWLNYLRPHIKRGEFTEKEDKIINEIYFSIGSRWSIMADKLPGRTDNDIKNYWNTKLKKKIVGDQQKARKKPSFRGLINGGMSIDSSPPVFTITNGHLMSTSWPSNTDIHNHQDQFHGCTTDGDSLPVILSFSTGNTTSTYSSDEGGATTNSAPHDLPKRKTIEDFQSMPGQLCFPTTISSGGGAEASPTISGPPMNNIIKDRQSTICQFCLCENISNSSSYDSLNKLHSGVPDIDMDTYMNTDINVDGGSTSTPLEATSTSLKELQNLLFDGSPTPNTATTNPFRVNVIQDSNDYFFQNHFENQGSWDEDATISSLTSSLPMEDNNNNNNIVDLLSNSYDFEGNFLPWNVSDQFA